MPTQQPTQDRPRTDHSIEKKVKNRRIEEPTDAPPKQGKKRASKKSRSPSSNQPSQSTLPTPDVWDQLNDLLRTHVTALTPGLSAHEGAGWEETRREWREVARKADRQPKGPKRTELVDALEALDCEPSDVKFSWGAQVTGMSDLIRLHAKIIAAHRKRVWKAAPRRRLMRAGEVAE